MHLLEVLPSSDGFIACNLSTDEDVGHIDRRISRTLGDLRRIGMIRLQIELTTLEWEALLTPRRGKSTYTTANISVIGSDSHFDDVGACLSAGGLFLQPPKHDNMLSYHNPHMLVFDDLSDLEEDVQGSSSVFDSPSATEGNAGASPSTDPLIEFFNNFTQQEVLCAVEQDRRLAVTLHQYAPKH